MPGKAKTRLIPVLGARGAALCHQYLLLRTVQRAVSGMPVSSVCLCRDQHRLHPLFLSIRRRQGLRNGVQGIGDLGVRMARQLRRECQAGYLPILVGSDCADCVADDVGEAARALCEGVDCVIGPSTDGGYYLIALRRPCSRLFYGIAWGSSRVLEQTLSRARSLGLDVHLLAPRSDVDTPADLKHWKRSAFAG